jgi:hypothetical protein
MSDREIYSALKFDEFCMEMRKLQNFEKKPLDYSWLFKKFVGIISHFYGKFKGQIVASK